jgi:hypothetical protein
MLPSEMRLEPHDLRTGRAAAYLTAECLPLLPRERFSPLDSITDSLTDPPLLEERLMDDTNPR